MMKPLLVLAALVLLIPGPAAHAAAASGKATIIDGDTMSITLNGGTVFARPIVVRIYGIDAPETGQKCQRPKGTWNCSQAAIDALAKMTAGKTVHCDPRGRDEYKRLIAKCSTKGERDIGAKLVASGLAWAFVKYSTEYVELERWPRAAKKGIWQSKTQTPWVYRARRWEVAAQKSPNGCPIKGNIRSGDGERIYHAPWSASYVKTNVNLKKGERWFCTEAEAIAAGWRAPYR